MAILGKKVRCNINTFNLKAWRLRLGITVTSASEFFDISEFRYRFYEYFNICPKAIQIACVYIELLYITARQYSKYLEVKYPHKRYHRLAEDILIDGLIEGFNPTEDSISILLLPKQRIKFV